MFSAIDGVTDMSLLQKQRLSPQRERAAIQMISAMVCNFYVLGRTQTQSSIIRSITCVTRLTSRCIVTTTTLSAETSDGYNEHSSAVWNACNSAWGWPALERELILHSLWGCSSAASKCCHAMKAKVVGHLQAFISIQQILHNTPAFLLCTNPSRSLHCLSLQLSVLVIYPSAQDQLFSIHQ